MERVPPDTKMTSFGLYHKNDNVHVEQKELDACSYLPLNDTEVEYSVKQDLLSGSNLSFSLPFGLLT